MVAAQHYSYVLRELGLIRDGGRGNSNPGMVALAIKACWQAACRPWPTTLRSCRLRLSSEAAASQAPQCRVTASCR